jgi:hypothetical protein
MTLQGFASFAELISSIAVLATLIFVAFQIKQTNILLQRGEENVTMEEWSRIFACPLSKTTMLRRSGKRALMTPRNSMPLN